MKRPDLIIAVGFGLVAAASMTGVDPVADDWNVLASMERSLQAGTLFHDAIRVHVVHWSPLWFLTNAICYRASWGDFGVLPLIVVKSAGVAAWVAALLLLLNRWSISFVGRLAAAACLVLHQAHAGSLLQWKSVGAIYGNLFGVWAAILFLDSLDQTKRPLGRAIATTALFSISLLFKETSLTYLGFVLLVSLLEARRAERSTLKRLAMFIGPMLAVSAAFMILRALLGAPASFAGEKALLGGRYVMGGPADWVANSARLLLAVASPVSTIAWFDAVRFHQWTSVAAFAIVTSIVSAALIAAFIRSERSRIAVVALIGLVSSWFPVALLAHVSETYVSPGVFWYAVLIGAAVTSWEAAACRRRVVVLSILMTFLALHAAGFLAKRRLMIESAHGEIAAIEPATALLREVTPGAKVAIESPLLDRDRYSIYRQFFPADAIATGVLRARLPITLVPMRDAQYRLVVFRRGMELIELRAR